MSKGFSWVSNEFLKWFYYSPESWDNTDPVVGQDWDSNGMIEDHERLRDVNQNGKISDPVDWLAFYEKNAKGIHERAPNVTLFQHITGFRPDNPIHDVVSIENNDALSFRVEKTYKSLREILSIVKKEVSGKTLTPQEKLKAVYAAMKSVGFSFRGSNEYGIRRHFEMSLRNPFYKESLFQDLPQKIREKMLEEMQLEFAHTLFSEDVRDSVLDCDTSSIVAVAISHEMGWPVHLVRMPGHVIARWDDGKGVRFNIDYGKIKDDDFYVKTFKLPKKAIENGVVLRKDTPANIALYNKALYNLRFGKYEIAAQGFERLTRHDPKHTAAFLCLGKTLMELKKYKEAIENFSKVIELDPCRAPIAYYLRGQAKIAMGDTEGGKEDIKKSESVDS